MLKSLMRFAVMLAAVVVTADAFAQATESTRANPLFGKRSTTAQRSAAKQGEKKRPNSAENKREATNDAGSDDAKEEKKSIHSFNWDNTSLEIVLQAYAVAKKRTYIKDPEIEKIIADQKNFVTLKSRDDELLSDEEYVAAIEVVLEMYGIHVEPFGEKFLRVLPRKGIRKEGVPLILDDRQLEEEEVVVSVLIRFREISVDVGEKILKEFLSDKSGPMQVFKHTNSILVTDTKQNINRMREVLKEVDRKLPSKTLDSELNSRVLKYATAANIAKALQSAYEHDKSRVEEMNKALEKPETATGGDSGGSSKPKYNNPFQKGSDASKKTASTADSVVAGSSPFYVGKLPTFPLFLYDEVNAPNKLLVYTTPEEMKIYDDIIVEMDVPSVPDKVVKVYRMRYADAEEVASMITDLLDNSKSGGGDRKVTAGAGGKSSSSSSSSSSRPAAAKTTGQSRGDAKVGELTSDNTKVLADKRINGLVVKTERQFVTTIEKIIADMDVKLDQVLIETVIIEVGLNDDLKTGIDWVKGLQAKGEQYQQGIAGGGGTQSPISTSNAVALVGKYLPAALTPGGAGLAYAIMSEKFDLAAVISLSKSDTNSKYLASPVIMTVDNKEATIEATQMRYLFKGYQYSGSSYSANSGMVPDYEQKELGITIKATPKINPNGMVMLTVEEEYSQEGTPQTIEGSNQTKFDAATTITRKMSSDVSLTNGQTVVLGGLVNTYKTESETGIPILKDIPWIGKYLFGKTQTTEQRNELIVFMTPYVLKDADAAEAEAIRRRNALSDRHAWDDHGWSASKLADPVSRMEQLRRLKADWKRQDAERKAKIEIEQEKLKRVESLEKMSEKEREAWLEVHEAELKEDMRDELEKMMLDPESQEELKKIIDKLKARKMEDANAELDKVDKSFEQENEHARLEREAKAVQPEPAANAETPAAKGETSAATAAEVRTEAPVEKTQQPAEPEAKKPVEGSQSELPRLVEDLEAQKPQEVETQPKN